MTALPPPQSVLQRFSVELISELGGRANQHWLVRTSKSELVLRGYGVGQPNNIAYEHEVLRRLRALNCPVPELVSSPIFEDGRLWCLFTLLRGKSVVAESPGDKRQRGWLLAQFHELSAYLNDLGQRDGFTTAENVVRDPTLLEAIRIYETLRPESGRILRWHLEKTLELFAGINLQGKETIVLHSDFTPWNLLFEEDKLSGIIDFEGTHLNYRVSDFALSWRGYQHEVIEGYEQVRPLSERDWQLLVPTYWSWIFIGMTDEIQQMLSGVRPLDDFDWQVKQLLRRSDLHEIEPYRAVEN